MRTTAAVWLLSLGSMLLASACSKSRSFGLPELGDAELAFGAIYDATDRAVAVGPVVTRQRIKAGGYSIEAGGADYRARLFLVKISDLREAAATGCADLERRADQRACADLIASCEDDPVPCLTVFPAGERCGERLTLPQSLKLSAFESDANDQLTAVENSSELAKTLQLCGPLIAPPCPNMLPGWSITEGGAFRCAAQATQLACEVEIDLGDCGFGKARGLLDENGALTGTIDTPPCMIGSISTDDIVPGNREGAFAITCGQRRFIASRMEILFGEPTCARRGPPVFNESPNYLSRGFAEWGVGTGKMTGLKAFRPAGWSARYLFVGTGHDDCVAGGCLNIGGMRNCPTACMGDCSEFITLPDCAGANTHAPCTGRNTLDECLARCTRACEDRSLTCRDDAVGAALVLSDPESPEDPKKIVDLDDANGVEEGVKRSGALVILGERSTPSIAVASRRHVRVFRTQAIDTLGELTAAQRTLDFDIAGISALPGRPNELVVFGDDGANGILQHMQLTSETDPRLVDADIRVSTGLPSADAVVIGGPDNSWIFAASVEPPLGATGATALEVYSVDRSPVPAPIGLPGRPTAVGALADGAIAAGVDMGGDAADQLVILVPVTDASAPSITQAAMLPLAGDLQLVFLLQDPASCATQDRCRIYLGLRQRGASRDHGNALVGILEFDRMHPAESRIVPSYVETSAEELTMLEIDTLRNELIAIASTQNRLTPIRLW